MKTGDFYKKISLLTILLILISAGLSQVNIFQNTFYFSLTSIGIFFAFTVVVYHLAAKTVDSPNKNLYSTVAFSSIIVKLIMMMAVLFIYKSMAHPVSRFHFLPFILIYLVFTAFETLVLMKLAKPST